MNATTANIREEREESTLEDATYKLLENIKET